MEIALYHGGNTSASTGGMICATAQDCPGMDTPCAARSCVNGICGMNLVAAGMDALTQTPGDCQKDQCDGQGNVVTVPDPTDVPVSGNMCVVGSCAGAVPMLALAGRAACRPPRRVGADKPVPGSRRTSSAS